MTVLYIIKLVLASGLCYAYYYVVLRNKRMHLYNRFYLLGMVALSIVLPFIQMPLPARLVQMGEASTVPTMAFGGWEKGVVVHSGEGLLAPTFTSGSFLVFIYVAGMLFIIIPLFRSLWHIGRMSRKHTGLVYAKTRLYHTAEPGTPFSFLNKIFWNQDISLLSDEGKQVLRHELVHVQQKHSCDILFMEIVRAILWFNPFYHLVIVELKVVHEYLADESSCGSDRHQYAGLLVKQVATTKHIPITNHFYYKQIQRRIAMLLHKQNSKTGYGRKLLAIPLAILLFCACSDKTTQEEKLSQPIANNDAGKLTAKSDTLLSTPVPDNPVLSKITPDSPAIYTKVEIEASFPGGAAAWQKHLGKTLVYPKEAIDQKVEGTVIVQSIVDLDGTLSDVKVVSGTNNKSLQDAAVKAVAQSGMWLPAIQNGKKVKCYKRQPITFKL